MNIDDVFKPLDYLTNLNQGDERILKEAKLEINKAKNKERIKNLSKDYKNCILKWYLYVVLKNLAIFILIQVVSFSIIFYFKLSFKHIFWPIIISFYILLFILENYRKMKKIQEEIQEFASEKRFVDVSQIHIY